MRISKILPEDIVRYARLSEDEYDERLMEAIMDAAKKYISGYTGVPPDQLDDHEDFSIVFMVLCQDMYDNRTLAAENTGINRVVDTILGMHSRNLIGGAANAGESGSTE